MLAHTQLHTCDARTCPHSHACSPPCTHTCPCACMNTYAHMHVQPYMQPLMHTHVPMHPTPPLMGVSVARQRADHASVSPSTMSRGSCLLYMACRGQGSPWNPPQPDSISHKALLHQAQFIMGAAAQSGQGGKGSQRCLNSSSHDTPQCHFLGSVHCGKCTYIHTHTHAHVHAHIHTRMYMCTHNRAPALDAPVFHQTGMRGNDMTLPPCDTARAGGHAGVWFLPTYPLL